MEKLFYSISEVAKMFSINQSNLRFWEKEFPKLKPRRSEKGTRHYSNEDLEVIKQIIYLVEEQKLTLDGAKQKMNLKLDLIARQQQIAEKLRNIREDLIGISHALSK